MHTTIALGLNPAVQQTQPLLQRELLGEQLSARVLVGDVEQRRLVDLGLTAVLSEHLGHPAFRAQHLFDVLSACRVEGDVSYALVFTTSYDLWLCLVFDTAFWSDDRPDSFVPSAVLAL